MEKEFIVGLIGQTIATVGCLTVSCVSALKENYTLSLWGMIIAGLIAPSVKITECIKESTKKETES